MQELEKILEEIENIYVDETDFGIECNLEECSDVPCDNCYECIKSACKVIIRNHMNDGWVPVEEALPEDEGFYLVTFSESKAVRLLGYGSCRRNIKWEPTGFGWYDISTATYFAEDSVIAWQPLPEPYRPERSDNHDGE